MEVSDAGVALKKNRQRDLIFRVGTLRYAIPVSDVVEVFEHPLPPYPVAGGPKWFAGIINHHGNAIPVVHMSQFWAIESKSTGNQIILIRETGELIGLAVDQIESIEEVEVEGPLSGETRRSWLRGALIEQLDTGVLADGMRKRAAGQQG
jgi:chemotaxis signal transduction protein